MSDIDLMEEWTSRVAESLAKDLDNKILKDILEMYSPAKLIRQMTILIRKLKERGFDDDRILAILKRRRF